MENNIKQETNWFKRVGIRIWYNDFFRMLGIPLLAGLLGIALKYLEYLTTIDLPVKDLTVFILILLYLAAFCYNDYENLYRIGRDLNGRKMKDEKTKN